MIKTLKTYKKHYKTKHSIKTLKNIIKLKHFKNIDKTKTYIQQINKNSKAVFERLRLQIFEDQCGLQR